MTHDAEQYSSLFSFFSSQQAVIEILRHEEESVVYPHWQGNGGRMNIPLVLLLILQSLVAL